MTEIITETLPPFLLNSDQVAEILGTSKSYAYTLMRRGELPVVRLGRAVRVRPGDLDNFIKASVDKGLNGSSAW